MSNLFQSTFGLLKRIFFLFFYPDKLLKLAQEHTPTAGSEQLQKSIHLVRGHVFRALRIALGTAFFSWFVYFILSLLSICIPHRILLVMRFFGYVFVLWGIFSPAGWKIQTFKGETLPEIVDEEWHRLIYMFGLTLLLLSYLFEI